MAEILVKNRIDHDISEQEELKEKAERQQQLSQMKNKLDEKNNLLAELERQIIISQTKAESEDITEEEREKLETFLVEKRQELAHTQAERNELQKYILSAEFELGKKGNFNKHILFSNIRQLLKHTDAKLGQIEREAGCQPGYMSRLEKEGNTTDPSVEFVVTAAKTFSVSVDVLIGTMIEEATATEQYLMSFVDKLNSDTLADKLNWEKETASELNQLAYSASYSDHPLFNQVTFSRESECEYPDQVTEVVFSSDSYGPNTRIDGDCYNLQLKNDSVLYVMKICKDVYYLDDPNAHAIEVWIHVPGGGGTHCLAKSTTKDQIGPLVDILYKTISENMKHPKVKPGVRHIIDAFMEDDLANDADYIPEDILPFS